MPRRRGGRGRFFLRGSTWWIAYSGPKPNGEWGEIRESTESGSEDAAKSLLVERLREIANDRSGLKAFAGPTSERIRVRELLDNLEAYYRLKKKKSASTVLVRLRPEGALSRAFGSLLACNVTPTAVSAYVEARMSATTERAARAPATVNRELELLGRAFSLAIRQKRIPALWAPAIDYLPEPNAREGFFEKAEHERLLPHLPAPLDDVARFGYLTGWRRGEILSLRWDSVDRAGREIRLGTTKNGHPRMIAFDEEDWALLERRWDARRFARSDGGEELSAYVFHRKGRPLDRVTFARQWHRACAAAKLPGRLFHDYRRTAARDMLRAGVSQAHAMRVTGHETDSMFRRYAIASPDDLRSSLRRRREHGAADETAMASVHPIRKSDK